MVRWLRDEETRPRGCCPLGQGWGLLRKGSSSAGTRRGPQHCCRLQPRIPAAAPLGAKLSWGWLEEGSRCICAQSRTDAAAPREPSLAASRSLSVFSILESSFPSILPSFLCSQDRARREKAASSSRSRMEAAFCTGAKRHLGFLSLLRAQIILFCLPRVSFHPAAPALLCKWHQLDVHV